MALCFLTFKLKTTFVYLSLIKLLHTIREGMISFWVLNLVTTCFPGKHRFIKSPIFSVQIAGFIYLFLRNQNYKLLLKPSSDLHSSDYM